MQLRCTRGSVTRSLPYVQIRPHKCSRHPLRHQHRYTSLRPMRLLASPWSEWASTRSTAPGLLGLVYLYRFLSGMEAQFGWQHRHCPHRCPWSQSMACQQANLRRFKELLAKDRLRRRPMAGIRSRSRRRQRGYMRPTPPQPLPGLPAKLARRSRMCLGISLRV